MKVDMKFEVAIVPVSDVDRAKAFYTKLGWRVDDDIVNGGDSRIAINCALMILRKRRVHTEVLFDSQSDERGEAIAFEVRTLL